MRSALMFVALIAGPLAGCEKIDMLQVTVRSPQDIAIHLPSGRCLDKVEIGGMKMKRDLLWQIEKQPGSRGCLRDVIFPHVPAGFANPISADTLPEGSYQIAGTAQDYAVAGHFDLPTAP